MGGGGRTRASGDCIWPRRWSSDWSGHAFRALLAQVQRGRKRAHPALVDAPAPGWLILMGLGALVLIAGLWLARRFAPKPL